MNKVILMGRLTRDPDVRYSAGESGTSVARYTLAVDRRFNKRDGEATADFISCVAFGRSAEFAEKYFHQGLKVVVTGRVQTGSYTNRDGKDHAECDEDHGFFTNRLHGTKHTGIQTHRLPKLEAGMQGSPPVEIVSKRLLRQGHQ